MIQKKKNISPPQKKVQVNSAIFYMFNLKILTFILYFVPTYITFT